MLPDSFSPMIISGLVRSQEWGYAALTSTYSRCKRRKNDMTETPVTPPTAIQLPGLHHIGLVVRDRDATIRHYKEIMGFRNFFTYDTPPMPYSLVYGKPASFTLRVGYTSLGNTLLELLQPLDQASPLFHFLEEHGEGIHHIGFIIPNLDDYLARIEEQGLHILAEWGAPSMNVKAVYLQGDSLSGTALELMQDNPIIQDFYQQVYQAIDHKSLQL
jgi:catechol 2,3-dioxygenase-like lactoylglutathione lyase family enzyme